VIPLFETLLKTYEKEAKTFGNFPNLFMGLVSPEGLWETYYGHIRFVDSAGNIVADKLDAANYHELIGQGVQPDSYLKSPYYRPLAYPDTGDRCRLDTGTYCVGPLARLKICSSIATDLADKELKEFRSYAKGSVQSSFFYHYARLIEILACIEHIKIVLDDPDILSTLLRAQAGINQLEAVGVSEAPRGALFHHYQVDENGLMEKVNLIIARGQDNLAMNRTVAQIVHHFI
jgi:NAD-reducing hydrogenase large subunit